VYTPNFLLIYIIHIYSEKSTVTFSTYNKEKEEEEVILWKNRLLLFFTYNKEKGEEVILC
jgi:hypothetical protein